MVGGVEAGSGAQKGKREWQKAHTKWNERVGRGSGSCVDKSTGRETWPEASEKKVGVLGCSVG